MEGTARTPAQCASRPSSVTMVIGAKMCVEVSRPQPNFPAASNLTGNSLRCHLEGVSVAVHLELDLVAADLALIAESAEGPLGRERDFVPGDLAVLNRSFVLRACHSAGQVATFSFESEGVHTRRPIGSGKFRLPLAT